MIAIGSSFPLGPEVGSSGICSQDGSGGGTGEPGAGAAETTAGAGLGAGGVTG